MLVLYKIIINMKITRSCCTHSFKIEYYSKQIGYIFCMYRQRINILSNIKNNLRIKSKRLSQANFFLF